MALGPQHVQLTFDGTPARWIASPLNYPGGKYRLLDSLFAHFPDRIATFYDAFAGGGTVSVNVAADAIVASDVIPDLVQTMQTMQTLGSHAFIAHIQAVMRRFDLIGSLSDLPNPLRDPDALSRRNAEPYRALRHAFNTHRDTLDPLTRTIWWYTLVLFGFNNQIRTNRAGAWNTPVGKSGLNPSLIDRLTLFIDQLRYRPIRWVCQSYTALYDTPLTPQDFVYFDPPYSITTAVYNTGWSAADDAALWALCDTLTARGVPWALSNVLRHHGREHTALKAWARQYRVIPLAMSYANASYHHTDASRLPSEEVLILG
jgi:DNA adenine methylase Dam